MLSRCADGARTLPSGNVPIDPTVRAVRSCLLALPTFGRSGPIGSPVGLSSAPLSQPAEPSPSRLPTSAARPWISSFKKIPVFTQQLLEFLFPARLVYAILLSGHRSIGT